MSWPDLARTRRARLLAGACLALFAGLAAAAEVPYTYVTSGVRFGSPGVVDVFAPDAVVSGRFTYDASRPPSGTLSNGATRYDASFLNLVGQVQSWSFDDPRGYTAVGNDLPAQGGSDFLMLGADPGLGTGTHNLNGFTVAGWTLVNVRLFWIEGQLGIGDFTGSDAMPAVLPGFDGVLALDFVPASQPNGPLSFVFFERVTVSAVPEPASAALLAAGLAGLLLPMARRRRLHGR